MIAMTDAQQARVHPFRGEAAPMPDADAGARWVSLFWKVTTFGTQVTQLDYWKRGVAHAPAPFGDRMRAAIESFEGLAPARDPEIEAVMLAMLDYWSRRGMNIKEAQGGGNDRYFPIDAWFIWRWLAAGGLPFALRVLETFPRVDIDASRAGAPDTHALAITPRDGSRWWCLEVGHLGIFQVLRRVIATSNDYAAGVAEAARIRAQAPLFLRAALAFAFPDEPWWQADLRDATPKKKGARLPAEAWGLATTRVEEAAIAPILDSMARDSQPFATDTAHYGYTLVKRFGDGAAKHLLAYLAVVKDWWAKEQFGDALALTETAETKAFFASKLKDRTLGKLAKAYVKNA